MRIVCDSCSTKYSIADDKVRGKAFKIRCKRCGHIVVVRAEGSVSTENTPTQSSSFDKHSEESPGVATDVWYVAIMGRQVGPVAVPELKERWKAGEIDKSTYAWKEGFKDWQPIEQIAELGFLASPRVSRTNDRRDDEQRIKAESRVSRTNDRLRDDEQRIKAESRVSRTNDALWDDEQRIKAESEPTQPAPSMPEPKAASDNGHSHANGTAIEPDALGDTAKADEFELFKEQIGLELGVFASSQAPSPKTVDRKAEPIQEIATPPAASATPEEVAEKPPALTGARNEHSVLFSLADLTALTGSVNPSNPALGKGKTNGTKASAEEGSGLIDIRAMAANIIGPKDASPAAELPILGTTLPAASVLLPTEAPSSRSGALLYAVIGIGLLAIAAIGLVIFMIFSKPSSKEGTLAPAPKVAEFRPVEAVLGEGRLQEQALGAQAIQGEPEDSLAGNQSETEDTPGTRTTSKIREPSKAHAEPKKTQEKEARLDEEKSAKAVAQEDATPRETTEERPADKGLLAKVAKDKCDEVACLVDSTLSCCKKSSHTTKPTNGSASNLPERLERADIVAGISTVRGRVMSCNDDYKVPGTVKVRITIAPSGSVSKAEVLEKFAGTPLGACVERAVKNAQFAKFNGTNMVINYPFAFH